VDQHQPEAANESTVIDDIWSLLPILEMSEKPNNLTNGLPLRNVDLDFRFEEFLPGL